MIEEIKPKRKLKSIDFSSEDSHIALVHKDQGGPANGADYRLVLKATHQKPLQISEEFVKKASQVKVTLSITDYLQKFYGLWYEDAEALARVLGFTTVEQEYKAANPSSSDSWYEDYITEKVASVEIMKSLYQSDNLAESLSELDGPQYLSLLQDQAMLEKSFKKIERLEKSKLKESSLNGKDTSQVLEGKEGVSPIVKKAETIKENKMEELEKVNKALQDNKVMLEKAMEQIAKYESDKKEAIVKSKTDKVKEVIKDVKHAEILTKACLELESEDDFTAFMAAITAMQSTITTSDMFVEKGLRVDESLERPTESLVMQVTKARIAKATK